MKQLIKFMALCFFLFCVIYQNSAFAETNSEKYLGERLSCLELSNIYETSVFDDQTILIGNNSGDVYINRLPDRCVGLRMAGAFAYKTSISKLCKQDIIKVLEEGSGLGSVCGLGEFIRFKGVKKITDAVKLLKDGVLEALIREGAFNTSFPSDYEINR